MLFNSIDFGIFLPVVAVLYWTVFNRYGVRLRNAFLLACSWFFYGMWDWRFLGLLIFSSTMDYTLGRLIGRTDVNDRRKRKALLVVSLVVNLGILGFFKYANFFIDSIDGLFTIFGMELSLKTLNIILPVGISFYTFQSLSYIIDVYPQLVAGPIERASHLLPQFDDLKKFDYDKVREGLVEVFVGLIKKMVIADRLAVYVDSVFQEAAAGSSTQILGFPSVLALIFFAFQLYIDFSAYSQIAIGTAKILGFSLCTNFRRPYLSSSFNNFWERWHISLSQWMRDYIFIPLGGSREGRRRTVRNLLIVFAVSGLWHGASWNFVIWGLINGLFVILLDPLLARSQGRPGLYNRILSMDLLAGLLQGRGNRCGMDDDTEPGARPHRTDIRIRSGVERADLHPGAAGRPDVLRICGGASGEAWEKYYGYHGVQSSRLAEVGGVSGTGVHHNPFRSVCYEQ